MQTGSGISHEEETIGDRTEFFQIWFEPDFRETTTHAPTYLAVEDEEFPVKNENGVLIKTVLGEGSPATLEARAHMQDVIVPLGRTHEIQIAENHSLAMLAVSGTGLLIDLDTGSKTKLAPKDFAVIHGIGSGHISIGPANDEDFRFIGIYVPTQVDYPLYSSGL